MDELIKFRLKGSKDKKKRKSKNNNIKLPGYRTFGSIKNSEEKEKVKIIDPKTGAVYYEYRPKKIELNLKDYKND